MMKCCRIISGSLIVACLICWMLFTFHCCLIVAVVVVVDSHEGKKKPTKIGPFQSRLGCSSGVFASCCFKESSPARAHKAVAKCKGVKSGTASKVDLETAPSTGPPPVCHGIIMGLLGDFVGGETIFSGKVKVAMYLNKLYIYIY